jgi:hypothetical protein
MTDPRDVGFDELGTPILTFEDGARGWVLTYLEAPGTGDNEVSEQVIGLSVEDIELAIDRCRVFLRWYYGSENDLGPFHS